MLVVEDNPADADCLAESMAEVPGYAFQLVNVSRVQEAIEELKRGGIDAIILDLNLPDSSGIETLRNLEAFKKNSTIVVLSGNDSEEMRRSALDAGAHDFIGKNEVSSRLLARSILYSIERVRAEQKEEQFSELVALHPDAALVTSADGAVRFVNQAAIALFGRTREQLVGGHLAFSVRDGELSEIDILRPDGTKSAGAMRVANFKWNGEPAFLASIRDITEIKEKRALEDQLRQSQKLESVGRLAGGIAHDFNNILTVILGYGDLLQESVAADDPSRKLVEQICSAGKRAAKLTRQLLAFSRQEILQPRTLDLNTSVTESKEFIQRLIGEDIQVRTVLEPSLWRVKVDPSCVNQIIMNLAVNSRDAMPSGGTVTIETHNVTMDAEYIEQHVHALAGDYVMLAIADTGTGMDRQTQARIFDPFFTTKEKGKGTGLGLATVYGIVKQSGGFIWVYSELGQGTTFKVYLPRTDAPQTNSQETAARGTNIGTETVLLVEDDQALRDLAALFLQSAGYKMLSADCPEKALDLVASYDGEIHLLLTDVILPGINGRMLAEKIVGLRPAIKVLYVSGYTDDTVVRKGIMNEEVAFLQKPYTREALSARVREILDGNP
jgi:signal transduction histidine kinase